MATIKGAEDSLARRLRWLMFFRVVTATFLLGTTVVIHFRSPDQGSSADLMALYGLITFIYFLTFLYAAILPRFLRENIQAYLQVFGDILITLVVIYLTGGLESAFSFMFILTIINAGVLLKIRGAVLAASASAIGYGALLDLHYYNYIDPFQTRFTYPVYYQATDILITILINMGAFYLVAILSGYLTKQAEESRRQLKARETDIERLEELNESIIQSMDSGLMTIGAQGKIMTFNPAAERITGFTFEEVKGRPYTEIFPGLAFADEPDQAETPSPVWNWVYHRADGQRLYLDLGLVGLRDRSGASWRRLLVLQDRTQIRRMEEEVKRVERLAAIGEMAAGIAHEIRNPLASMSGSFQILEQDLAGQGDHDRLLAIIRREMDRLNHLVTDFLLFARPRSGAPETFLLSPAVGDILTMFAKQAGREDNIRIVKDLDPQAAVRFDRHQFEQILWNLLINAAEAIPEGGEIRVCVRPAPEGRVLITVSDNGDGIAPEDLPRIFDPFFTTKSGGSGLGLSIVHRILVSGGGRIEVASQPGRGTTFSVHLAAAAKYV
ncbi:MAG: ATP-binding protein [Thermodesulfobacteriota bacterium]